MTLHLLLTNDIAPSMPPTCKMVNDFGRLTVEFDDGSKRHGQHMVVEDTEENIVAWLRPFDGFVKGNGWPQTETFEIAHVK